jgi:hypothetical protein
MSSIPGFQGSRTAEFWALQYPASATDCKNALLFTFFRLSEQIAQPIQAPFDFSATTSPPGLDAASTDSAEFCGLHQAAFLQYLQVLHYRG